MTDRVLLEVAAKSRRREKQQVGFPSRELPGEEY
jgi:hypothetical protein